MRFKIIKFKDHPEFTPNLTPSQIFELGSFGGTYWRPIHSTITGKNYKNIHLKYPRSLFNAFHTLPNNYLTNNYENYDRSINYYKVKVGTTLEYWENKKWITKQNPYGWVQWYCDFYMGKRTPDDIRQIKRWGQIAGKTGRFYLYLQTLIKKSKLLNKYNNKIISPKIRQTLLHWAVFVN
jgi:hypothetical protein